MEQSTKSASHRSRALCILGMHRSGTSTVARAINLLGVPLGDPAKMMPPSEDNSEGYWEHLDIYDFQTRLMARLERNWDTVAPLPAGWLDAEFVQPFKEELARIVQASFDGFPLWAWKEPQTCLLLPLWREILQKRDTDLSCLFVVRSPVDVAGSLMRRDGIPFPRAVGIWFHNNIVALKDAAALPMVFSSYDRLLEAWEPELRRCAAALGLDWPKDETQHREAMNAFIKPGLRHNRGSADRLKQLPRPVQELYEVLREASNLPAGWDNRFEATINRLSQEFHDYASFFSGECPPPSKEDARELMLSRLSNSLDAFVSSAPKPDSATRRDLVIAWRTRREQQFECFQFQATRPPPVLLHRLLGDKLCRSLCKRLAETGCWLNP